MKALLLVFGFFITLTCLAQQSRTIQIRMLNAKTAQPITTSDFQVWFDHQQGSTWVHPEPDGTATLSAPTNIHDMAVTAQYQPGAWAYVHCDAVHEKQSPNLGWYSIPDILTKGIVAPNHCSKANVAGKPGEFVFFVRKQTFWEKMKS
jgi:hypothetical protein